MYVLRNRIVRHAPAAPSLEEMTLTIPMLTLTDMPAHKSMSTFKPVISASQVAALIGRNPYRPFNEVALDILSKDSIVRNRMNELTRTMQRTKISHVKADVFRTPAVVESKRVTEELVKKADTAVQLKIEVEHAVEAVKEAAVTVATTETKVAQAVEAAHKASVVCATSKVEAAKAEGALRAATFVNAPAPVLQKLKEEVATKTAEAEVAYKAVEKLEVEIQTKKAEVAVAVKAVEKLKEEVQTKKVAAEIAAKEAPNLDVVIAKHEETVRQAVAALPVPAEVKVLLEKEATGDIVKARGNRDENKILNAYETTQKVVVEERNTKHLRLDMDTYVLTGRTDGWVASKNRVVDAKNRKNMWSSVPVYDIVQLRVYMKMLGCKDSELVERFPDGTTRNTVYTNDPKEWDSIQTDLEGSVRRLIEISQNDAELQRVLEANTVASF